MTQDKHTPGPWEFRNSSHSIAHPRDEKDRKDMYDWCAGVEAYAPYNCDYDVETDMQDVACGYGKTSDEAQANSRLIAAARNAVGDDMSIENLESFEFGGLSRLLQQRNQERDELLETLEYTRHRLAACDLPKENELMQKIIAAIAKARGQS